MKNKLLGTLLSLTLCAGLCPVSAMATEPSAFDNVVEQFAEKDKKALQRMEEANGDAAALFDSDAFL